MSKPILFIFLMAFACSPPKEPIAKLPTNGIAKFYDESQWPFYHGVASGDPLTDRVIIWTRVTPKDSLKSVPVTWQVATDANFTNIVSQGETISSPQQDYTVKVDAEDLNSGTSYFYRFQALEKTSPTGETKTLPKKADHLNLAIASCSNYEFGPFNGYRLMANMDSIDMVLHLGDYIYEYGPGTYGDSSTNRFHYPPKELISLQDYRLRYSQYRLDQDLQTVHSKLPFVTIWDDHEIANNSYKEGAQNHQPDEGDYNERKTAAKKAYYEWLPVRSANELYRSLSYGQLADIIMLDERLTGRTGIADSLDDPLLEQEGHSMLGSAQLEWFKQQLTNSKTQWKLIGNQVIFSYLNWGHPTFSINLDSWDGYPKERTSIKEYLLENDLSNIIFVTGDTHSSWAFEVTDNPFEAYDSKTGDGAFAVEFGTTSINSGNSNERFSDKEVILHEQKIMGNDFNPHLKYANLRDHGFLLLNLTTEKATAQWFYTTTNKERTPEFTSSQQIEVASGETRLNVDSN